MRAYKVSVMAECELVQGFAGTKSDASAARQTLVDKFDVKKSLVKIEEVDIPTDKGGLLAFINKLVGAA